MCFGILKGCALAQFYVVHGIMLHHCNETQLLRLYQSAREKDALLERGIFYRCNILYTIYTVSPLI